MAEAIILPIAKSILIKIASFTGNLVFEEFKALKSFQEDLDAIKEDLHTITAVLEDVEAKQYSNATMKIWVRDLKSVVYDIDDLLDEVATDSLRRTVNKDDLFAQLWYNLSLTPFKLHFHLIHKMKDIRLQLKRVVDKKNRFDLTVRPVEPQNVVERGLFNGCGKVRDVATLGRDDDKNNIMDKILGVANESSLSVLPIIGMGGIGKTAFAKLVYNDIQEFDLKLWACVSDKLQVHKLLEDILIDAMVEIPSYNSLGLLVDKIRGLLNGKRFLLVLDDLWEDDVKKWRELKDIFKDGGKGSVILITTRVEKVASITHTHTVGLYHLERLSYEVCWNIFKDLAFGEDDAEWYQKFYKIGESIVDKCCGNPLVVQSLASMLRGERDEREWMRIKNLESLNKLDGQYDRVKQLLRLSYDKLPTRLKPYFTHLAMFPKDYEYEPYFHLYCLSALGSLHLGDTSPVQHNLLDDLFSRSMLQDVTLVPDHVIASFKIHDLLHDVANDVLGEELTVVTDNNLIIPHSSRYILWQICDVSEKEFPKEIRPEKTRAFFIHYKIRMSQSYLQGIIFKMPYLRILFVGSNAFEGLPTSIGRLKHLRVLNLAKSNLITLPDTICDLLNLECLMLIRCKKLEKLPAQIYKLISLRHFALTTCQRSLPNFHRFPSLQYLSLYDCEGLVSLWDDEDAGGLTSLRSLSIGYCPKLRSLPNSTKQLVGLQELVIANCEELDLDIGEGLSGLQSLQTLLIWNLPRLTQLPKGARSFASSLRILWIIGGEALKELPIWFGSYTSLQHLYIVNCPNLLSLPEGIRETTSLQRLLIRDCPHVSRRCAYPDGEDWLLILHARRIVIEGVLYKDLFS